ncbi:MAG: lysophospholipid acyltransferase family protein [Nostocoides sp.]
MKRHRPPVPPAYAFAAGILRPTMFALTRRDWRGAENLPASGGFLACSNHISYADPVALAHYLFDNDKPPHFLGKHSLFEVPVVGAILRRADQIPVFRETGQAADAFGAAVAAVASGKCIAIYPEGTLTRDPDIWPMTAKTGAARIALTTRCPVIPIGQWGAQAMLAPYGKRLHLIPRPTMQVTAGPPVDLSDLHDQPLGRDILTTATNRILAAITAIVEDLRGETAPAERFDARAHGLKTTGNFKKKGRRR